MAGSRWIRAGERPGGWEWVPVVMVVLAGLGLILGLSGRSIRDRLVAEAAIDRDTAVRVAATVPDIHLPPEELLESDAGPRQSE